MGVDLYVFRVTNIKNNNHNTIKNTFINISFNFNFYESMCRNQKLLFYGTRYLNIYWIKESQSTFWHQIRIQWPEKHINRHPYRIYWHETPRVPESPWEQGSVTLGLPNHPHALRLTMWWCRSDLKCNVFILVTITRFWKRYDPKIPRFSTFDPDLTKNEKYKSSKFFICFSMISEATFGYDGMYLMCLLDPFI